MFLDTIYDKYVPTDLPYFNEYPLVTVPAGDTEHLFKIYKDLFDSAPGMSWSRRGEHIVASLGYSAFKVSLESLQRLGLLIGEIPVEQAPMKVGFPDQTRRYYILSALGFQFVMACRAPKRKDI